MKDIIEKIKVSDIIETKQGEFTVTDAYDVYEPSTLERVRCILVDFNGKDRKISNEDILGIKDNSNSK